MLIHVSHVSLASKISTQGCVFHDYDEQRVSLRTGKIKMCMFSEGESLHGRQLCLNELSYRANPETDCVGCAVTTVAAASREHGHFLDYLSSLTPPLSSVSLPDYLSVCLCLPTPPSLSFLTFPVIQLQQPHLISPYLSGPRN